MKPTALSNAIHIFRAGTHVATNGTEHSFSEADIADLVASYEPSTADAPLVVGHPKIEDAAYGWVERLVQDGPDVYAVPRDVEPQFAELVNSKRFPKISASIYLPDTPGNPKPGRHYVKHIGFLGAAAPSLKGLKTPTLPASFAASGEALEFSMPVAARHFKSLGWMLRDVFQRLRDSLIARDGVEAADRVIPQYQINGIDEITSSLDDQAHSAAFAATPTDTTEIQMSQQNDAAEFAARETALTTKETDLNSREAALKKREDDARRADTVEFAEGLVNDGRILPRHQAGLVELLLALPAGTVLNFAENEGDAPVDKPAVDMLREFLTSLPKQLDFAEKSGGDHGNGARGPIEFAAPTGMQVDAAGLELHAKAVQYQAAHQGVPYLEAVKAVGGR